MNHTFGPDKTAQMYLLKHVSLDGMKIRANAKAITATGG